MFFQNANAASTLHLETSHGIRPPMIAWLLSNQGYQKEEGRERETYQTDLCNLANKCKRINKSEFQSVSERFRGFRAFRAFKAFRGFRAF